MGFAEFIIGPAKGRTRWLYPSDDLLVVRSTCYRLRQMQEFVERDGAFRNAVARATVDKDLRVMVEDLDDKKGLPCGASH
ncbi:hypothetical protein JQ574_03085 [Bradyrhizobium sp. AUGA SZCCT0158]|uniref:hypothetical protein n=1 Tax=Bradyrhizobium sp. AUGA SZCCT0158 TaxID=2807661 RepID=UPI001BAAD70D|nr:hypothetical protein [Bradyrhizobium sp. AUGA SZCCT0158]MBR1195008.1 hypothetical protein [Bradyrhizobium sp. AUGA SZCCT0158]